MSGVLTSKLFLKNRKGRGEIKGEKNKQKKERRDRNTNFGG